jgi:hypothetical protein
MPRDGVRRGDGGGGGGGGVGGGGCQPHLPLVYNVHARALKPESGLAHKVESARIRIRQNERMYRCGSGSNKRKKDPGESRSDKRKKDFCGSGSDKRKKDPCGSGSDKRKKDPCGSGSDKKSKIPADPDQK